jgi:hypothetical protein
VRRGTAEDMRELISAIKGRDGDRAARVMEAHLTRVRSAATQSGSESLLPPRLPARTGTEMANTSILET